MIYHAAPNNDMHPTRDTQLVMYNQSCGRAGDAGHWAASLEKLVRKNLLLLPTLPSLLIMPAVGSMFLSKLR